MYYGLILFNFQKILKLEDIALDSKENDIKRKNFIIKLDRIMLFVFIFIFLLFNVFYFIIYNSTWLNE